MSDQNQQPDDGSSSYFMISILALIAVPLTINVVKKIFSKPSTKPNTIVDPLQEKL